MCEKALSTVRYCPSRAYGKSQDFQLYRLHANGWQAPEKLDQCFRAAHQTE